MQYLKKSFIAFLMTILFISCGDDNDDGSTTCTQTEFVGTYSIIGSPFCASDTTITGPETFFLEAGLSNNILIVNGDDGNYLIIDGCVASGDLLFYTLMGDQLTFQLDDCSWNYSKS